MYKCVCAEEIERTDKRKEYKNVPICVHKLVCDYQFFPYLSIHSVVSQASQSRSQLFAY